MSQEDVQLVISAFTREGAPEVEMGELMRDDELWERNGALFSEDVKVRFVTPGDKGVNVMQQDFQGVEGLREGWAVWMEPWEEFRVIVDDLVDTSAGQVLVLASAVGKVRGSGAELPQEVAVLCSIENGKIAEVGFYLDQAQARRDAELLS